MLSKITHGLTRRVVVVLAPKRTGPATKNLRAKVKTIRIQWFKPDSATTTTLAPLSQTQITPRAELFLEVTISEKESHLTK